MNFFTLWSKLFTKKSEMEDLALHVAGTTVRHKNPFEHVEVPRNNEKLSGEFIQKWVAPFYIYCLSNRDEETIKNFADASKEINIDIVKTLLGDFNWRTRITGAYFAAINNYKELDDIIGRHLLKSEVCYAGIGYCVALTTFATDKSLDSLATYLNYYLGRKELDFDQATAFCALEYLDKNQASNLIEKWNSFVADKEHRRLEISSKIFQKRMLTLDKIRQAKSINF